jgi:hypothetical protein
MKRPHQIALMAKLEICPTLIERIRIAQEQDDETTRLKEKTNKGLAFYHIKWAAQVPK